MSNLIPLGLVEGPGRVDAVERAVPCFVETVGEDSHLVGSAPVTELRLDGLDGRSMGDQQTRARVTPDVETDGR